MSDALLDKIQLQNPHRKLKLLFYILGILALIITIIIICINLFSNSSTPSSSTTSFPLGANLNGITDWSPTPVYVDIIHSARTFGSANTPWDGNATLGPDGWPIGDFGVVLMTYGGIVNGTMGNYTIIFNGSATVKVSIGQATLSPAVYNPEYNYTTVILTMLTPVQSLMLAFVNTGTGIKNLKILRPGYNMSNYQLFTNEFLNYVSRFSTFRFMDWLETNGNMVQNWSQRTSPETYHTAPLNGVPWEYIISLANFTLKDIWINIPVLADDDYVVKLATMLKNTLNPVTNVYVEYSNELWNSGFSQFGINAQLSTAYIKAYPNCPLNYDNKSDPYGFRRTAWRLKNISDIFRSIWGNSAINTRIRPVLSGQIVNPYIINYGLDMIMAVYGPPSQFFYAVAGAPYMNLGSQQTWTNLTADDVINALNNSVNSMIKSQAMELNLASARWNKLKFISYEGGYDTFGPGSLSSKQASQYDPRAGTICQDLLDKWYYSGGDLFMWFVGDATSWNTQYGTWGLVTDLNISTPKLECIDQIRSQEKPEIKVRHFVPGIINALETAGSYPPYSNPYMRYIHVNSSIQYLFYANVTGEYSFYGNFSAYNSGNAISIALDGDIIIPIYNISQTGNSFANSSAVQLEISKGLHTIRIKTIEENLGWALSNFYLLLAQ